MYGKKKKQGFSLFEMLASILAFSILTLSVGIILVRGWTGWRWSNEAVAMQRDASLALKVVSREIRCSSIDHIDTSTDHRIFFGMGGVRSNYTETIELQGPNLVYTGLGGGTINLLDGTATDFVATTLSDRVEVVLEYHSVSGESTGRKEVIVYTRN